LNELIFLADYIIVLKNTKKSGGKDIALKHSFRVL